MNMMISIKGGMAASAHAEGDGGYVMIRNPVDSDLAPGVMISLPSVDQAIRVRDAIQNTPVVEPFAGELGKLKVQNAKMLETMKAISRLARADLASKSFQLNAIWDSAQEVVEQVEASDG